MKLTVEHSVLKSTIPTLARIVKKTGRMLPVLEYILLRTAGESVIAMSTDLEAAVQFTLPACIDIEGSALVNAEKLTQIVSALPAGPVVFDTDPESQSTKIVSASTDYNLPGRAPEEYPAVILECEEWTTIEADTLTSAIDTVAFAAHEDDSRMNLSGVYIEPSETGAVCVATDGHRLALCPTTLNLGLSPILVPSKGISELRRVLDSVGSEIQIGFHNNMLMIGTENSRMSVRCLDGEYPDYRKVIPVGKEQTTIVARNELVAAIKRVAVLSTDKNKAVQVSVGSGKLELQTMHPDLGTAKDVIGCSNDGDGWDAYVNVYYLQDALGAFACEQLHAEWYGAGAPIVFRAADDNKYFNLIMPMRK